MSDDLTPSGPERATTGAAPNRSAQLDPQAAPSPLAASAVAQPGLAPTLERLEVLAEEAEPGLRCALCGEGAVPEAVTLINGRVTCLSCLSQLQRELAAERDTVGALPLALLGGGAGALVAALIWTTISVVTNVEIGYVAVLVGYLAGRGVRLGAGRARGPLLQVLAVAWALVGLAVAKYMIFAYLVVQMQGGVPGLAYLDPGVLALFTANLGSLFGPFDLLWVLLAVGAAWQVPRGTRLVAGGGLTPAGNARSPE